MPLRGIGDLIVGIKMSKPIVISFAVLILTVVVVLGGLGFIERTAKPSRDLSKMMSVRVTLAPGFEAYYQQHDGYPDSLEELPIASLQWGDENSSPSDLEEWHYVSDGKSFKMTWQGQRGLRVFFAGKNGKFYFSEDDFN